MGLPGATLGRNVACAAVDGGIVGLVRTPGGGGPGRDIGCDPPGYAGEGNGDEKGGGWPKGDGLGAEPGRVDGGLFRLIFCMLSAIAFGL